MILFILVVTLPIYFMPTIIAYYSNHKRILPIFLLNLFLGWTIIGWVGALVWSVIKGGNK